ncbi:MAG: histidinol-phosphate transaminase [Candidatus Cyclobacteriaceae bacterium M2_1C_046]
MKKDIKNLVRKNIIGLEPYEAARHLMSGPATFLDANENPYDSDYNRYPDPWQRQLKEKISEIKNVPAKQIFIGNGSDEAIDLLMRIFCNPGKDNIIITPPTYGMYQVSAAVNDVELLKAPLKDDFSLDIKTVLNKVNSQTKLIFLCSPNNPTGNVLNYDAIEEILNAFEGIVIIDEAYIDFASAPSWLERLNEFKNLVVLQTLSKAYGMAGLRVGLAFGSEEILNLLNKVKPPYNISILNQKAALQALANEQQVKNQLEEIIDERERLNDVFEIFSFAEKIYPSDANFILIAVTDPNGLFSFLKDEGVIVRNRSNVIKCEGCLRVTVGTPEENDMLINKLKQYEETFVH